MSVFCFTYYLGNKKVININGFKTSTGKDFMLVSPTQPTVAINVSLTYLRGLEIAELKEEDMPLI
ncbi:hypothetical protein OAE13_05575 [Flavobacteriaceae bacterium]|nr:hypothetical protein [Flavobacteriaceae bacterium]